jgi:exopolysaccharide production protein ExoQ
MNPQIASAVFMAGILGLFYLDRDKSVRVSNAVWISATWVSLTLSRMVSQWMQSGESIQGAADMYLDGSPLDRNILSAFVILAFIVLFQRGRRVTAILQMNWALVLFFAYSAISVTWSDYPDVSIKRWFKAAGDVAMVLIVLTDENPNAALKKFLARMSFILVPLSVLFIKYYPDLGRGYLRWTWEPIYRGVATGKNELGMLCLLLGLGAVWRVCQLLRSGGKSARRPLIAHGAIVLMALWLLEIANSMTSLTCFAMGFVIIIATSIPRFARKTKLILFLAIAMPCVAASALFLDIGSGMVQSLGRDPSLTGRTGVWELVLKLQPNPIVGAGFEGFWLGDRLEKIWDVYWWHPNEAHNGYLEVYLTLGAVGVMLLIGILLTGYRNAFKALRSDAEAGGIRIAYLVIALAYNFTESAVRMMHPVWIFLIFAMLAVPAPATQEAEVQQETTLAADLHSAEPAVTMLGAD